MTFIGFLKALWKIISKYPYRTVIVLLIVVILLQRACPRTVDRYNSSEILKIEYNTTYVDSVVEVLKYIPKPYKSHRAV